ncbi:BREX system P-loop protein BrxC [Pseudomaricurvus alcaniphilus]|uniref:BREX system P-loop protein BrxC n=1 Tax=Pseudomaricurvus alcaniphilus TaxID=1166482 RepID=UPI00140CA704|nr:BREX system P-loop protein BrxC [Pseudomaricurvus alcaniphilus]
MLNQEIYAKDPLVNQLANNGVAEVKDDTSTQALNTLRYELETFVCDGEYEKGLDKILSTFLINVDKGSEQPGVWISGFYGSGKSHLAKMLRALWTDYDFNNGTSARGIAKLPTEINDHLKELTTQGRRYGGLHAASGTLGQGGSDWVRMALLSIVFKSAGLPELYHLARFVIWLRQQGIEQQVREQVEVAGKPWLKELNHLFMSPVIAKALISAKPDLARDESELRLMLREEYKRVDDVSNDQMVEAITDALSVDGKFPLTLIVLDEVQQYIGDNADRAYQVQEAVETCCKHFKGQLLFVGTGQNALSGMPNLMRLMGRFQVPVQLSDTDVESVIRKIILQKKSSTVGQVERVLQDNLGEISRHLRGTKVEYTQADESVMVADYPVLPVRRRFWEKVLRIVDTTGTVSQLRNQLKVIHEAAKVTATKELGNVVSGDFIYGQIAPNLLQTAMISKDVYDTIARLRAGGPEEQLQSQLLALIFLIGKLPTEAFENIGVKATSDVLADLLVDNLSEGSTLLRKRVPEQLAALQKVGLVMAMATGGETEYRLQTQESSQWHDTYRQQEAEIAGNPQRIETERDDLLSDYTRKASAEVRLAQGDSKEPRKLTLCFDPELPREASKQLYAWVQHGWQADEKSVIADARADSPANGTLYVFIPARNRSDVNHAITTQKAAAATLDIRGLPSSPEGKDARKAMETRLSEAEKSRDRLLAEIFNGVRVFISGGTEIEGNKLKDKLENGARVALERLYKQFDVADDANWGKVVEKARKDGGEGALAALHFQDEPAKHPVCSQVLRYIGSGKKGSEVRENFQATPYGWPQDAIDGALYALLASGALKAKSIASQPVDAKGLERKQLTQTWFEVENVTISTAQKLAVRKLLVDTVGCNPGDEERKAAEFLQYARDLAKSAGGAAPRPHLPDTSLIDEIAGEAGNSRLVKLYDHKDVLAQAVADWQTQAQLIAKRLPAWEQLKTLLSLSRGLSFQAELQREIDAIEHGRRLLDSPDPVEQLVNDTTDNLRASIQYQFEQYKAAYDQALIQIETDANWCKLDAAQQQELLGRRSIKLPQQPGLSKADDVIDALEECAIEQWNDRTVALVSKFDSAREEAAQLLMPKAVRASLPRRTLQSEADIQQWLKDAEQELKAKLAQGPVIV